MCNPNMEAKVHELMELKRMKEELEAEIAAAEEAIKAVMETKNSSPLALTRFHGRPSPAAESIPPR